MSIIQDKLFSNGELDDLDFSFESCILKEQISPRKLYMSAECLSPKLSTIILKNYLSDPLFSTEKESALDTDISPFDNEDASFEDRDPQFMRLHARVGLCIAQMKAEGELRRFGKSSIFPRVESMPEPLTPRALAKGYRSYGTGDQWQQLHELTQSEGDIVKTSLSPITQSKIGRLLSENNRLFNENEYLQKYIDYLQGKVEIQIKEIASLKRTVDILSYEFAAVKSQLKDYQRAYTPVSVMLTNLDSSLECIISNNCDSASDPNLGDENCEEQTYGQIESPYTSSDNSLYENTAYNNLVSSDSTSIDSSSKDSIIEMEMVDLNSFTATTSAVQNIVRRQQPQQPQQMENYNRHGDLCYYDDDGNCFMAGDSVDLATISDTPSVAVDTLQENEFVNNNTDECCIKPNKKSALHSFCKRMFRFFCPCVRKH